MMFQRNYDFQRGRGIGSLFDGLAKSLIPLAKVSADIGKRVIENEFVQDLSKKALEHGAEMAKNIASDVLEGKDITEAASDQIEITKKKITDAVQRHCKKRKHTDKKS